jgi:hypothetical protein
MIMVLYSKKNEANWLSPSKDIKDLILGLDFGRSLGVTEPL